ncbi:hypothetical protein [Stenotrophomonas maltophilia]|uniref:hypothetical protein n=1 Tax=Stenotrophomonas maltophilia TaxID=40324 RepID=UPI0039C40431
MSQESREERIKRLLREREEGTLTEKPAPTQIEESPVEPVQEHDWEEEARIVSGKNRERIKKNAELAAAQAKAATELAEKGAKNAIKSLQGFKAKVEAKLQEEKEKRRLKCEGQEETKRADVVLPTSDNNSELPAQSGRVRHHTRMRFWLLCSIPTTLSIILVGFWLFTARETVEATKTPSIEQPKTERAVEAVLTTVEEPPQDLPPLPQEPHAEQLVLEAPITVAEKEPMPARPTPRKERVAKVNEKKEEPAKEPAKSQWQKDAAQKLDDYQF